jgi:hypothetical protein
MSGSRARDLTNGLVDKQRLADVLNLRNGALQIEGLGEDDLEDLGVVLA